MSIQLSAGDRAPPFILDRDGGGTVSLADFAGRKLVVYFYPRAGTPGCTLQSQAFSAAAAAFAAVDTAVLGVSADPVEAQNRFKAKHGLAIPLASDPTHAMLAAYGVWGEKSLYGKTYMGIVRTTFLIDHAGVIARVWPKVRIAGHVDEVLAVARAL